MGRARAVLLAVVLASAVVGTIAVVSGVGGDSVEGLTPNAIDDGDGGGGDARTEPMLVGFMDDVSFRWHPSRATMLDRARQTGGRLIRALVAWDVVAPKRPAPGALPFEEPRLHELDELVDNTRARGMEVMITLHGTPAWANGGLGRNHAPADLDALRDFAQAIATRYPSVKRYSVWNEPNIELFLAPQFDKSGRSVAPETYAEIFRAAYEGIKAASPDALVAIGETSSHGKDKPSPGAMQDRHSPAGFAERLSKVQPPLEFDAWAHHPYPVRTGTPPDGEARWPNVTLPSLARFEDSLAGWFGREVPIWITEIGYEVAPAEPHGVPEEVHAAYAAEAIELAAAEPAVEVFVWFAFADSDANAWESGLLDAGGRKRQAFETFTEAVSEHAQP